MIEYGAMMIHKNT